MSGFSKHKIVEISTITENAFLVKFERNGLNFIPGQYIVVGIVGDFNTREYSIYSGANEDYIEILVREIKEGYLSQKLKKLKQGDFLIVYGPYGEFVLDERDKNTKEFIFIATGTGISPLHSIVKSFPTIDYKIIHGVRYKEESYGINDYNPGKYIICASKDKSAHFYGRVTDYLKDFEPNSNQIFYISGNNMMITDVISMLKKKGVKVKQYNLEIYF